MSQIPIGPSRLKAPSKIVKPVQGGSGGALGSPAVVKPRTGIPSKPEAGAVKPRLSSGRKTSTDGSTAEVVRRGSSTSSLVSNGSEKGSRLVSPRGSLTPKQGISRENSASRLQYKRESSSSSLRGDKTKTPLSLRRESSQGSIVKRRGSGAVQDSADLLSLYKLGDRVLVGESKTGVIAYIGETRFAKGDWVGVVLDEAIGKNDGSVAGVRYFECEPLHGVFSKVEKITKINQIVSEKPKQTAASIKTEFNIGDRVVVSGTKHGVIRFLGETGFAKGEWVGVELDEPLGKNDGAVAGTRYFQCEPNFGLFAPHHKVVKSSLPLPGGKRQQQETPSSLQENSVAQSSGGDNSPSSSSSTASLTRKLSAAQAALSPEQVTPAILAAATPKAPSPQLTSQVVALQEALQEREREIQVLLAEREFEKTEVANATSQVTKAEEELSSIKEKQEQVLQDNRKSIEHLQELVDNAEKEKVELQSQLEEERRKVEDLQFKLEEEEITLGDELKTEQREIEVLSHEVKEKTAKADALTKDLQLAQTEKENALSRVAELEQLLSKSNSEITSLRKAVADSQETISKFESTLSDVTSQGSSREGQLKEKEERISALARELKESTDKHKELEKEFRTTTYELSQVKEENDSLKKSVEGLTAKLRTKEGEFASLSAELGEIKNAAIEMQTQLNLSAAKEEHLSADKSKLESEIAELVKNSGDSSERLTYLNEQLRENSRIMDELKVSEAEAQIQIGRLTEDLVQAKASSAKDVEQLQRAHAEETKSLEDTIMALRSKLEQQREREKETCDAHQAQLEELKTSKYQELSVMRGKLDKSGDEISSLSQALKEAKSAQEQRTKERDNLKDECSKVEFEYEATRAELSKVSSELKALGAQKSSITESQGDAEKKYKELATEHQVLIEERENLAKAKEDALKVCNQQEEEMAKLKSEKESVEKRKLEVESELKGMKATFLSLQKEIEEIKSATLQKEEQLRQLRSSSTDGQSKVVQLQTDLAQVLSDKSALSGQVTTLEEQLQQAQEHVQRLRQENSASTADREKTDDALRRTQAEVDRLKAELDASRLRENNAKVAAEAELQLKQELSASQNLVKRKEEELLKYKQEVESLKNQLTNAGSVAPSTGNVTAGDSAELERKLAALTSEKDDAHAEIDFLNSVIVDLKRKYEEAEQRIELLVSGEVTTSANGLDISDLEDRPRPGFKQRLFCDICDEFDKHDTDDCPTQASGGDDGGVQYHGDRAEQRPYCETCEVFGHWTVDCDDEETF